MIGTIRKKCLSLILALAMVVSLLPAMSLPALATISAQNFESVPVQESAQTNNPSLSPGDGFTYSTDSINDALRIDTIANTTALTSMGFGQALSSNWYGSNTGTYFQFKSIDPSDDFKLESFEAEVFSHNSQMSEIYTITGYNNGGAPVASATINFALSDTYGVSNSTIVYSRQTVPADEGASNFGRLTFTGSDWSNIDQLRMTVADSPPNTILGVVIDNIDISAPAPRVTDANISISGATGTGGAYKIGDTVTATWNNRAGGDHNSAITGVTVDFTQFGGGAAVAATNNSETWTATYTIVAGDIDTTNRNVSVTATDNAAISTTTADTTNATLDNVAPTVTDGSISISGGTGTGGAYKIGDTVTATWNNTGGGDNNSDTISGVTVNFSAFGGGAPVAATNSAGTWTATYTIVSGAIDAANRNVSVTATDNAGNSTTTSDTTNATVDNVAPTVTDARISISGGTGTGGLYKTGDTVTATWNNTADGDNNSDTISGVTTNFIAFGGGAAVAATNSAGTWTATYTIVAGAIEAANRNVLVTATDNAGNSTTTADTTNATVDNAAPGAPSTPDMTSSSDSGASATDNITNDTTPTFTGTAEANSTVTLFDTDGTTVLGTTTADGSGNWSITSSALGAGAHTITAKATDEAGNVSAASAGLVVTIVATAPSAPSTPDLTAGTDSGASSTDNITNDTTPTFTGTAEANSTVKLYDTDGTTLIGIAIANGAGNWSITTSALAAGVHTITAKATDEAGNVSAASTGLVVTVDTTAPTVSSASVPANSTYTSGQNLAFTVNFDEAVTVTGTPRIALIIGASTVYANYVSGSDTAALSFRYTVATGDIDPNGVTVGELGLNAGSIKDTAGNDAILTLNGVGSTAAVLVDAIAPSVTSVGVPANGTYKSAQNLDFTVNFDENVTVTGTPRIALTIGASAEYADYLSGSGTSAISFTYTVAPGDADADGIAVGALGLNAGSIKDAVGNDATLTLNSVGSTAGVLIDANEPTVSSISRQNPLDESTNATSVVFRVTFSESVTGVDTSDFALTKTGTADGTIASVSASAGTTIDVTVNSVSGNGTLRLDLNASGTDIKDTAGNEIAGGYTGGQTYTIDSSAPAVTITSTAPNSTNTSPIPVTITFSENVTGFTVGDLVVGNGTAGNFVAVSGSVYTADITPIAQGAVTVDVASGVAQDAASNNNTAATQLSKTYDMTAPAAGGTGTITAGTITSSSTVLSWTAATDPATAAASLQYKVVYSTSNNITTVSLAETNGTVSKDWTANVTTATVTGLTASTDYYFNVLVKDPAGNKTVYTPVTQKTAAATSGGSGGSSTPTQSSTVVEVNGQKQDAGTSSTTTSGGQSVTTILVDDTKLDQLLASNGEKPTITLPSSTGADVVIGQLNGQSVKNMEAKEAVLEIKTKTVSYKLPAAQINIDEISSQLGSQIELKDIKVSVKIAQPPTDTVKIVEDTAHKNSYQIVVKPVEFEITCTSGGKTVGVSKFNGYVERTVAIPEGVDPSKITTGIVLNNDGTFSHVPTQIVVINGKNFAKINSLTNSIYSVIYNPVTFADVASHWAKDAINDMGSRMVVTGIGGSTYEPDRSITRAEFAAIVVRALGLRQGTEVSSFGDVTLTDWFNGYVDTATDYALITGYDSGTFGPSDTITREQAMAIMARAMKLTGMDVALTDSEVAALLSRYTDSAQVSAYAKESAAVCLKEGIVNGTTTSTISSKSFVTRAEVAVMVQRLLQESGLI